MGVNTGYKQTDVGVIPEHWEVKHIADFASVGSGGTPSREIASFWGGSIPWITTSQIDFGTITEADQFITEEGLRNSAAKLLPAGTLLMALYGQGKTRGKVGVLGMAATTNQACASITLNRSVSREFILHFLASRYEDIRKSSNSGSQENLNGNIVKGLLVVVPPLAEQRAIAEALSDVDGLLGGLHRLIGKKRDLKQSAIQQLLTGKTRLPGFDGEWEVKRLGDVASLSKGTQLHSSETVVGGRFAHLNGGITPSSYTHKSNTAGNTIAISEGGNSCGFVQLMTEPYWCGGHCYSVIPNGVNNHFLYQALKGQQSEIMGLRVGSGLPNVQKSSLLNFNILLPLDLAEQAAISEVLTEMDAELAALEQRREKTRAIKQGMMQQLLSGKVRLV